MKRDQLRNKNLYHQPSKRLAYLCLQATREGQASYAHVHEIIKGLQRRGWDVKLFEPKYKASEKGPDPATRILWFLFVQLKLLFSRKPDILYIRNHFASWPTAVLARLRRIPVVQEVNGPYEDLFIAWPFTRHAGWLFKWLIRTQLRWATAVIAVTPGLADWVKQETGNPKVWVIPNGVNTELFRPDAPIANNVTLPENFVVFFGALAPWQGIDTMLDAVEEPDWPAEVKLVIMGDGAERVKVTAAVHSGKLIYLGRIPYYHVPGIVARSLAGLSPQSSLNGRAKTGLFPLKVFETLACGVPVIVTDFPGMADLVKQNRCGLVIPPDDSKSLAKAARYLYEHTEIRQEMGIVGRKLVEEAHSWDRRAEKENALLQSILCTGRRKSKNG